MLALKRHERPEEGYWQDFLRDFHQRRRAEVLRGKGVTGWWERATAWFKESGSAKWAYATGLAYAVVMLVLPFLPRKADTGLPPMMPVKHQVIQAPEPVPVPPAPIAPAPAVQDAPANDATKLRPARPRVVPAQPKAEPEAAPF